MKTYTTEQVWRLLKKHPTWTFEAPRINWIVGMSAYHSAGKPTIEWSLNGARYLVRNRRHIQMYTELEIRTDWVRTNKPKPVLLETVSESTIVGVVVRDEKDGSEYRLNRININPSKTYKVYLVECD